MKKIKELFNGEHGTFFKFLTFNVILFIVLWLIGPGNTVIHWAGAALEINRQERQMEDYREKNAAMDHEVRMLKTDRDTLEKFAREQYGFAVPGEDVYIMSESR